MLIIYIDTIMNCSKEVLYTNIKGSANAVRRIFRQPFLKVGTLCQPISPLSKDKGQQKKFPIRRL